MTAVLPASGKNGDDTGWVRFKLPIVADPGQIQSAVDTSLSSAATRSEGQLVYGMDDRKLGTVQQVMIDKISGKIAFAVLSFGGVPGMGED